MPDLDLSRFGVREINLMPEKGRTIMIYGEAGVGKTSLLNTLKGKILLINNDCGEQVLDANNPDNEFDICSLVSKNISGPTTSIQKLNEFVGFLSKQEELPWDYIVMDNISEMENTKLQELVETSGVKRKAIITTPDQNAYNEAGFYMLTLLKRMRNLTYKGPDVIYIAWEKTNTLNDFGGEVQSDKGPMLIGQTQKKVNGLVDFLIPLRVDKKGVRHMQLDPDNNYAAKKREEPGVHLERFIECDKDSKTTLQDLFDLIHRRKK